jgi:hypothetical protein
VVALAHLGTHLTGGRRGHPRELVVELGQGPARRRVHEVRRVHAVRLQRAQDAEVETLRVSASLDRPRGMQRLTAGVVVQDLDAAVRLDERRHGEAHVSQRIGAEAHADHSPQSKSLGDPGGVPDAWCMVNHPHLTKQLMAARERDLLAAAAGRRRVRELPASHRRPRLRLAGVLAGRRSSTSTCGEPLRGRPSWRAS